MKIYNSLTRKKEEFVPLKKGEIRMYVCGPTVYDEPHIGHARSAYIFDVIRRYLAYRDYKVKFVRNVTDVDDKIIEKARAENREQKTEDSDLRATVTMVAKKYLCAYHEDMGMLGIMDPDEEPKATEYIPKMINFIELLIKRDCAYAADGDVYFNIKSSRGYGKLSNQSVDKMEVGARIAPGEKKRDGLDFALWKAAKEGEPSWKSPWGMGRPGWHIECSVMSSDILGDEFDIHGGGIDLIFPHHENEVAQSEGAGQRCARYWMHNGLLTIRAEKMAKSLGNFVTIKDFLSEYGDPDYLKLFFLSAHYRSPIDYRKEKIEEAKKEKERFRILLGKIDEISKIKDQKSKLKFKNKNSNELEGFRNKFEKAMDDDFNTPLALAALFDLVTHANKFIHSKDEFTKTEKSEIAAMRSLLADLSAVFGLELSKETRETPMGPKEIQRLIDKRDEARLKKDFKLADKIREGLSGKGVILEDSKDGTKWRIRA